MIPRTQRTGMWCRAIPHARAMTPAGFVYACMLIHFRSLLKKCWVTLAIMLMTSSVYMGSSIYSPAITQTMTYFGLGQVPATLGLSLFVVGYVPPLLYFHLDVCTRNNDPPADQLSLATASAHYSSLRSPRSQQSVGRRRTSSLWRSSVFCRCRPHWSRILRVSPSCGSWRGLSALLLWQREVCGASIYRMSLYS